VCLPSRLVNDSRPFLVLVRLGVHTAIRRPGQAPGEPV
jgi:hypothetical protein